MKAEIHNLIILDESGSMDCVHKQTISGCNETINTAKSAQEMNAETQEHTMSIYAFQSSGGTPSRYLVKNVPAQYAKHITESDYKPWGGTPLYDAVGDCLTDLKACLQGKTNAIGNITIITDGYENASSRYTKMRVANMIAELKEMGWNFSFIGANIDVQATANSLNIENSLEFQQDEEGTKEMFARERESRMAYSRRLNEVFADAGEDDIECGSSIITKLKNASKKYFDNCD